jgi:hypothetical protein
MATTVSALFAARLAELEREHLESQRKTAETLASVKATIAELEALEPLFEELCPREPWN